MSQAINESRKITRLSARDVDKLADFYAQVLQHPLLTPLRRR